MVSIVSSKHLFMNYAHALMYCIKCDWLHESLPVNINVTTITVYGDYTKTMTTTTTIKQSFIRYRPVSANIGKCQMSSTNTHKHTHTVQGILFFRLFRTIVNFSFWLQPSQIDIFGSFVRLCSIIETNSWWWSSFQIEIAQCGDILRWDDKTYNNNNNKNAIPKLCENRSDGNAYASKHCSSLT